MGRESDYNGSPGEAVPRDGRPARRGRLPQRDNPTIQINGVTLFGVERYGRGMSIRGLDQKAAQSAFLANVDTIMPQLDGTERKNLAYDLLYGIAVGNDPADLDAMKQMLEATFTRTQFDPLFVKDTFIQRVRYITRASSLQTLPLHLDSLLDAGQIVAPFMPLDGQTVTQVTEIFTPVVARVKNQSDQDMLTYKQRQLRQALLRNVIQNTLSHPNGVETLTSDVVAHLPLNQTTLREVTEAFGLTRESTQDDSHRAEFTEKFDQFKEALIEAIVLDFEEKVPLAVRNQWEGSSHKRRQILIQRLHGITIPVIATNVKLNRRTVKYHLAKMYDAGHLEPVHSDASERVAAFETKRLTQQKQREVEKTELRKVLEDSSLELTPLQRTIIELIIEGKTRKDIEKALDLSRGQLRHQYSILGKRGILQ